LPAVKASVRARRAALAVAVLACAWLVFGVAQRQAKDTGSDAC
jgi:hypothetical protein